MTYYLVLTFTALDQSINPGAFARSFCSNSCRPASNLLTDLVSFNVCSTTVEHTEQHSRLSKAKRPKEGKTHEF